MRTYIIINPSLCDRAPITNTLIYTPNSILGRIIAKSPAAAKLLLAQLKLDAVIPVSYYSRHLTASDRAIADTKPLLAQQQPNPRQPTPNNPRNGGRIRQGTQQNLTLVLSDKAYEKLRNLPSMGKFVSELVEKAFQPNKNSCH